MAQYFCDSAVESSGDGLSAANAKKTVAEMITLMNSASPGDEFLFANGGVWNEHTLTAITTSGTEAAPIIFSSYQGPNSTSTAKPSIRGFDIWDSGWTLEDTTSGNIYSHAWTGGASFVSMWIDTHPLTQLTWVTDVDTTFGSTATLNRYAVDDSVGVKKLYLSRDTNPNTDGSLIEMTGGAPGPNQVWRFTNPEWWQFYGIEFMGGNGGYFDLTYTTADTLHGEMYWKNCEWNRRYAGGIRTLGSPQTAVAHIAVENCLFHRQHTLSQAHQVDLSNGSGHKIRFLDNECIDCPQAHVINFGQPDDTNYFYGEVAYNFCFNCGDDFISGAKLIIPDGVKLDCHHNIVVKCGDDNIEFGDPANCEFNHNTLIYAHGRGVSLTGAVGTGVVYKNNVLMDAITGFNPLEPSNTESFYVETDVDSDYNCFYQQAGDYNYVTETDSYSSLATYSAASGNDANSIEADPQLQKLIPTKPEECFPKSTSPLIGAGVDLGYTRDFFGTPIPQGGAVDIGAIQTYYPAVTGVTGTQIRQQSAVNTQNLYRLKASSPPLTAPYAGKRLRVMVVTVSWDNAVTGISHKIELDSALGSSYDITMKEDLFTGSDWVWAPSHDLVLLPDGDALKVTIAASAGDTSYLNIRYEVL